MLEARLDESGQAPVYGEQDEDRHREVHRGLTSPLPSTPLPTVTRLSMAPTPAVCPTLKAMLDLSLSVRTRPTSPTTPRMLVTLTIGPASARKGSPRIAPRTRRAITRSAAR